MAVKSLSELRKSRGDLLNKVIKDLDGGGRRNEEDKRFWKLSRDKMGNGSAIIRFLPPMNGDELPWVKSFSYGFQGPSGKWYINESPSAIGEPDPVMELNAAAYASKDESQIEEAKKRKRRTQYIANILVVKDPSNPENDGKVFLFKFGKKILDMVMSKAKPEFEDDAPIIVWDIDEGANMRLRIKNVANYPNYDSSEWSGQSSLADSDEAMEEILNQCHRLSEFTEPGRFKTYDVLKKELDRAMNAESGQTRTAAERATEDTKDDFDLEKEVRKAAEKAETPRKAAPKAAPASVDDDDDIDAFRKMLDDF